MFNLVLIYLLLENIRKSRELIGQGDPVPVYKYNIYMCLVQRYLQTYVYDRIRKCIYIYIYIHIRPSICEYICTYRDLHLYLAILLKKKSHLCIHNIYIYIHRDIKGTDTYVYNHTNMYTDDIL